MLQSGETTTIQIDSLSQFVTELLSTIESSHSSNGSTVVTLTGDLGAGKTTLVQALARELGVTEVVTSPTFVVMKVYETEHQTFTRLVHIDAYRIEDVSELVPLRLNEMLATPNTLMCIEWAERILIALPEQTHGLTLAAVNEITRTITYEKR